MTGHTIVLRKHSDNFSVKIGKAYISIEDSLIPYLCDELVIEKGVTFEDFFNIILKHHEIYSEVFYSHLSGVPLSDFFKEWAQPDKSKRDNMKKLVVSWDGMEFFKEEELLDKEKGMLEIHWLPSFGGEGKDKDGNEVGYAVEFTPLNELKKYPLELVENTRVYNIKNDKTYVFFERMLTVYDVLSAIFYEITFVGSPTKRSDKLDDIVNTQYDIEKEFEAKQEAKSLDDILKNLKIDKPKEGD